jgi:hypothetical protein
VTARQDLVTSPSRLRASVPHSSSIRMYLRAGVDSNGTRPGWTRFATTHSFRLFGRPLVRMRRVVHLTCARLGFMAVLCFPFGLKAQPILQGWRER